MRWQIAYPTASALPSKPGGVMLNQTANTITAAIGTNQRAMFVTRMGDDACSITLIIWAYTKWRKKGSALEYD